MLALVICVSRCRYLFALLWRRARPCRSKELEILVLVWTLRTDSLDQILILGRQHLEHVLRVYRRHYHEHRPHRALDLRPPDPTHASDSNPTGATARRARRPHPRIPSHEFRDDEGC